ncbi:uncharacterized protein [Venturia canescens]|uniref:uncharacterized protein n=1 Tax=Venturia canescens TaxID=32260 RepID=UPI001C9D3F40|nr:uncharacterized protein LOC122410521 [Venturia canescens]
MNDYEMDENMPQRRATCEISNGLISWRVCSTPDYRNTPNVKKMSVDSGLEMNSNSNGSNVMPNENGTSNFTIPIPFGNLMEIQTSQSSRRFNDGNNETTETIEEIDQPASSLSEDVSEWGRKSFDWESQRCLQIRNRLKPHATSLGHIQRTFRIPAKQRLTRREISKKQLLETINASRELRLCLAASVNHVEYVERMLSFGVSPNCRDSTGRTPLHIAGHRGYSAIVDLLRKYGADAKLGDVAGTSPLQAAITCGDKPSITFVNEAVVCQPSSRFRLKIIAPGSDSNTNDFETQANDKNVAASLDVDAPWSNSSQTFDQQVEALSKVCSRLSFSNTTDGCQSSS